MKCLEEIKNEHEKIGLSYPRPIIPCDECGMDLIVCFGPEIKTPYLRHKVHQYHKPSAESWEHKQGKKLIVEYLNEGGKCVFIHKCNQKLVELPVGLTFEDEVTFENSRLDVVGRDSSGEIVACIEILHTSKTINVADRDKLIWVEITASDVIQQLYREERALMITFRDVSNQPCCNPRNDSFSIASPNTVEPSRLSPYKLQSEEERPIHSESIDDLTIWRFSEDLGYEVSTHLAECYISAAMKGNYKSVCNLVIEPIKKCFCKRDSCSLCMLWTIFLRAQRCLHCSKPYSTTFMKPYCVKCYSGVKRGQFDSVYHCSVSDDQKEELRRRMSWISKLPGGSEYGSPCALCKKTERTQGTNPYVWWFGDKKCLCVECLDKRLDADNIYDLDLRTTI